MQNKLVNKKLSELQESGTDYCFPKYRLECAIQSILFC